MKANRAASGSDADRLAADHAPNRRTVLGASIAGLTASAGCIAGEFPPDAATDGSPNLDFDGPDIKNPSNVKEDLQWWASIDAADDDEVGRPFPLTASWNNSGFGIPFLNDLIEEGHHVLPSFGSPGFTYDYAVRYGNSGHQERWNKSLSNVYKPGLSYCAEHDLPISSGAHNIASGMISRMKRDGRILPDKQFPPENLDDYPGLIVDGEPKQALSPFGPIEAWEDHGRHLLGNPYTKRLSEIYPDPPLVVWLDNNEGNRAGPNAIIKNHVDRFVEQYGEDVSDERVREIVHEEYKKRYHAMFDAAREAAGGQWGEALRFVAYNAWSWPKNGTLLRVDDESIQNRADSGEWERHDGSMPESYQNDWQVYRGKTDYNLWSMQVEATSNAVLQDPVFEQHPGFYYANIGWEGGRPEQRRKPANYYALGNDPLQGPPAIQRWDFDRYQGWLQFCMWAQRPRCFREFRGGASPEDSYYRGTFDTYVRAVDLVWETDEIQEFWKHGDLVENPNPPNWGKNLQRWFVLDCDANETQLKSGRLRVFSLALRLGEEPNRRWLVYAHAPLGGVAGATISLPEYGEIEVDATRSGSFTIVSEADEAVETVIEGRTAPDDVTGWDSSTPLGAGEGPGVYDLQFDTLSEWAGPWGTTSDGELKEYRMTPNAASGPDAPVFGAELVDDEEQGSALEFSGGKNGLWLSRSSRTNAASPKNRTFEVLFKPTKSDGKQIIMATGGRGKGYNIYLDGDSLYAGIMVLKGNSNWLNAGSVSAGEWHRVTLVLKDATSEWTGGKLHLYLDGDEVATGPGRIQPNYHASPHLGHAWKTPTHDGSMIGWGTEGADNSFTGRMARFKLRNDASPP